MRVMGVDPGSRVTGFGIIDLVAQAPHERYVGSGTIRLPSGDLAARLRVLYDDLQAIHEQFQPTHVVVEGLFAHVNWRSALVMGHARGVILLVAQQQGCQISHLQPRSAKKYLTGSGSATKAWVASMVQRRLGLWETIRPDASDALALALAYQNLSAVDASNLRDGV